jgi:tol-pal system protein YbgF
MIYRRSAVPRRLLFLFLLAALPAFPVAKEILQIQRDIALLQDQVRNLQSAFDKQLAVTQQLLNQNLDANNQLSNRLAVLEKSLQDQGKVLVTPLANTNARVDALAGQVQGLRDTLDEMNSRLSRLQQQMVDIKNIVSSVPAPAAPATGVPGSAVAPGAPAVSAEKLFSDAVRDYQGGNFAMAGPEFTAYIQQYPNTPQAAEAQYYLGDIFYQQKQYDQAAEAFDQVLERYPEGPRTPDAQYKKGMSLLNQGKRDAAAREFRGVISKFPDSTAASAAKEALRNLGLSARSAPGKSAKSRKK